MNRGPPMRWAVAVMSYQTTVWIFIENTGRPHSVILFLSYGSPHQYVFEYIVETPLLAPVFFAMLP